MSNIKKIVIAGIGGVGGYFGGLLAKTFSNRSEVEVHFLSRGENLKQIQLKGLCIQDNNQEFRVFPKSVSDSASDFPIANYVLFCTKSYDLEATVKQVLPCINENTVLIPLQNGVNSRPLIQKILEKNLVCDGCVYLISQLKEPGVINRQGKIASLFFGLEDSRDDRLDNLQSILLQSGIHSVLSQDIQNIIWERSSFSYPLLQQPPPISMQTFIRYCKIQLSLRF
ncbi:MAG: 2-dehydropantoate 2-reductase N-terminal domain-containing protein [Bacteroidota bacterium]